MALKKMNKLYNSIQEEITALKKENDRLEMKVAFLNVKENGGRGGPVSAAP